MSLRQSGFYCDVCNGAMVTEMFLNKPIQSFTMNGFRETFHCHDGCGPLLEKAIEAQDGALLPPGPMAECFRKIKEHNEKVAHEKAQNAHARGFLR